MRLWDKAWRLFASGLLVAWWELRALPAYREWLAARGLEYGVVEAAAAYTVLGLLLYMLNKELLGGGKK